MFLAIVPAWKTKAYWEVFTAFDYFVLQTQSLLSL